MHVGLLVERSTSALTPPASQALVRSLVSHYGSCAADEGYARQASSAAMAATAKAVAKLKLQQEQGPQLGSNGLPSPADPCNGNGGSSGTPAGDSETEAEAPHAVLLNPADSGYIADTEDGLALKKPSPPSNGHRSSSLRPRSRQ